MQKARKPIVMITEENVPPPLRHIIRQFGLDGDGNFVIEWKRPMEIKRLLGEAGIDLIGLASIPVGRGMKVYVSPLDQAPTDSANPLLKLV